MGKRIRNVLNGDLADPLNLNVLIYTCTYVLSVVFSFLSYMGTLKSEAFNGSDFLVVLTDCIVPTTATLVLGNLVQNFVLASQAGITRYEMSFWALLAVFVYTILYSTLRACYASWFFVVFLLASAGIVILGMHAIVQVNKELHTDVKSLSG